MLYSCTHMATVGVEGLTKLNVTTNKNNTNRKHNNTHKLKQNATMTLLNNEIQLKNNLLRLKLTFWPRRRPSSERSVTFSIEFHYLMSLSFNLWVFSKTTMTLFRSFFAPSGQEKTPCLVPSSRTLTVAVWRFAIVPGRRLLSCRRWS